MTGVSIIMTYIRMVSEIGTCLSPTLPNAPHKVMQLPHLPEFYTIFRCHGPLALLTRHQKRADYTTDMLEHDSGQLKGGRRKAFNFKSGG